jgi:hypothetical protein
MYFMSIQFKLYVHVGVRMFAYTNAYFMLYCRLPLTKE